jgi:hypothetical protein
VLLALERLNSAIRDGMDPELESLLDYLKDEFCRNPGVRVRVKQRSGCSRSPDLEQDYDPESHDLHSARGIQVRAGSRDYFFPAELAAPKERGRVEELVREIHDYMAKGL